MVRSAASKVISRAASARLEAKAANVMAIYLRRRKDLPRRGGVIGNWQALAAMLPGEASRVGLMGPRQPAFPGKVAVLQRAMRPVRQRSGSHGSIGLHGVKESECRCRK